MQSVLSKSSTYFTLINHQTAYSQQKITKMHTNSESDYGQTF